MTNELYVIVGAKIQLLWKDLSKETQLELFNAIVASGANIKSIDVRLNHLEDLEKVEQYIVHNTVFHDGKQHIIN